MDFLNIFQVFFPRYFTKFEDCPLVEILYRLTITFLLSSSVFVLFYGADHPAECRPKFARATEITDEEKEVCLRYLFTQQGESREYLPYRYEWILYYVVILFFIYFSGWFMRNYACDMRVEKFLTELMAIKDEDVRTEKCLNYFKMNTGKHRNLLDNRTMGLIIDLITNFVAFLMVYLLTSGKYLNFLEHSANIRDMENLSDPMTMLLPPYAECELTPEMKLWIDRSMHLVCDLPLMKPFELLLVIFWILQAGLIFATVFSLFKHILLSKCRVDLQHQGSKQSVCVISEKATRGDRNLLEMIKPLISTIQYEEVLEKVAQALSEKDQSDELSEVFIISSGRSQSF